MKIKILLGLVLCLSATAQAGDSNFSDCLQALNSKTEIYKNKVKLLTDDGQSFAVVNAWSNNVLTVYTPKGAFDINTQGTTPSCDRDSGYPGIEPKDAANAIMQMLSNSVAMGNDPKNSAKNKAEVMKVCMKNKALAKLWNKPPVSSDGVGNDGAGIPQ
jgi:hypothetical protein